MAFSYTDSILQKSPEKNCQLPFNTGYFTFECDETQILNGLYHIVLSIDTSGSMNSVMVKLKTMLTSILKYLFDLQNDNSKIEIYITLLVFNQKVYRHVKNRKLDSELYETLKNKIQNLTACGTTNFELPFTKIKDYFMINVKQNIHLFFTDGHPTCGKMSFEDLQPCIQTDYMHYYVGFDTHHNYQLLDTIAKNKQDNGLCGKYYYLDLIENAPLIYGDIFHNVFYKAYEHVTFTSQYIEFYNEEKNTWDHEYVKQDVCSYDKFLIHFRFPWTPNTHGQEYDSCFDLDEYPEFKVAAEKWDSSEYHHNHNNPICIFDNIKSYICDCETDEDYSLVTQRNIDVVKMDYRVDVLTLLNQVKQYIECDEVDISREKIQTYKTKVNKLFLEIKEFQDNNSLNDDVFIKQLLVDLKSGFISLIDPDYNSNNLVFYSRISSQANQRVYSCNVQSNVPSHDHMTSMNLMTPMTPMRANRGLGTGIHDYYDNHFQQSQIIDVDSYLPRDLGNASSNQTFNLTNCNSYNEIHTQPQNPNEFHDILNYQTPYICSAGNPQNIIDASPYVNQSQNRIVSHLSQTV